MPVSAETLRLLMDAGVHGDELLCIVASIDRTPTKERTANAERQARFRAKRASGVTNNVTNNVTSNVTDNVTSVTPVTPLARVEDNLPKNKIINKEDNKKTTPRDELAAVLDAEHADAVLDHRQRLRKPLSQRAAHLLAASLASCPDPNGAADQMIESGWLKIKPGWLESRGRQNGHSPPTHAEQVDDVLSRIINGKSHEHPGPTIDASYDRTDRDGSSSLVQFDAFAARR